MAFLDRGAPSRPIMFKALPPQPALWVMTDRHLPSLARVGRGHPLSRVHRGAYRITHIPMSISVPKSALMSKHAYIVQRSAFGIAQ
jgi:hypothetical protein